MRLLSNLRNKADTLRLLFERQCVECGYADQWDAYRKHDAGEQWPEPLEIVWNWYIEAQHEFYSLRDGPNGFLGKYGI